MRYDSGRGIGPIAWAGLIACLALGVWMMLPLLTRIPLMVAQTIVVLPDSAWVLALVVGTVVYCLLRCLDRVDE